MPSRRLILVLCGLAMGFPAALAEAQVVKKPSPRQDEKRENEAVKEAQQALQEAREHLKESEKSLGDGQDRLRKAITAQKAAASDLQKVQDRLESEHGERTGLTAARKRLKEVSAEYDRAAKPILERVHAENKSLVDAVEKARQRIKPQGDSPSESRSAAIAEHAKLTKELRELERKALEADETTKPLQKRVDDAESAVQTALKKFETAVEKDGDMKAARQAFEKSKKEVDAAETAIAKAQRAVAEARSRAAQATQRLQLKQAADAKDSNKSNRKPKK
jgi:chromosome segregation ATPase